MRRLGYEIALAIYTAVCLVAGLLSMWSTFSLLNWLWPVSHP